MSTVLESIAVSRASGLSRPAVSPSPASSCLSSVSGRRISRALPEFKGLRMKLTPETRSFGSASRIQRSRQGRNGRIVCESQDIAVDVPSVTDKTWKSVVLESESPVVVEFWAPWCGPCRMLLPIIDELAKQYVGKIRVYKINTDECPSVASDYGIRSIPTVLIFKNGEKKDTIIGAVPKTTLAASIEKFL
ncbi:thioredoxin 1-like [Tripterygium wilfordii]|uniref:thioredoxin 1-like n=1 Tax=Tripterygium wilfordii TaxID=458696 RepID=UPI0018F82BBF|nr:thioredoxin 1-like [Tripterygium wilfordii]